MSLYLSTNPFFDPVIVQSADLLWVLYCWRRKPWCLSGGAAFVIIIIIIINIITIIMEVFVAL